MCNKRESKYFDSTRKSSRVHFRLVLSLSLSFFSFLFFSLLSRFSSFSKKTSNLGEKYITAYATHAPVIEDTWPILSQISLPENPSIGKFYVFQKRWSNLYGCYVSGRVTTSPKLRYASFKIWKNSGGSNFLILCKLLEWLQKALSIQRKQC